MESKDSCRPPQQPGAGPGPVRKSGEVPAGPGTLRDSGLCKNTPGHWAMPSLETFAGLLQHSCCELCHNTGTALGWTTMKTLPDSPFWFSLSIFAGR